MAGIMVGLVIFPVDFLYLPGAQQIAFAMVILFGFMIHAQSVDYVVNDLLTCLWARF